MLAIAGAGDMVSGIFRMSILQAAVDDSMRGRLDGIGMAVWATGPSIGNLESGVVATLDLERAGERRLGRPAHDRRAWACSGCSCPGFARYDARHPSA